MEISSEQQAWIDQVERVRIDLVQSVIDDMYQNPFWEERYGSRGRKQSLVDANYNLSYLITALRQESPNLFRDYYHWLRGVLVFRGMCTQHLRETLDSETRHLKRLLPEGQDKIIEIHQAGYEGLAYVAPASHALWDRAEAIAGAVADQMFEPSRAGNAQITPAARRKCIRDNLYHLSYLADTVGLPHPDGFSLYIQWVTEFLASHNVNPDSLMEDIRLLREELRAALPEELAAPFLPVLSDVLED